MQGVSAATECAVSGEVRAASGCARECGQTTANEFIGYDGRRWFVCVTCR